MKMEADFINLYIERMQNTIHDLSSKNILLETQLLMSEKRNSELQSKLESLEEDTFNSPE